ncbi:MAG: HEAT repeat domain-containing protein [Gemmataceae bacterium]|nr:HEAT repeat domain-containing protein [Gemmataceae bacterium]
MLQPNSRPAAAFGDLDRLGSEDRAAAYLARFLEDGDPKVRTEAARALGNVGRAGVPFLTNLLAHPETTVRREAAASLGKIGPDAADAVPVLARLLRDSDLKARLAAATALSAIGQPAQAAISALVASMRGAHLILARLAAQALSRIGTASVPALVDMLSTGDRHVRREAAWALGQIGPAAATIDGITPLPAAMLPPPAMANAVRDPADQVTPLMPLGSAEIIANWQPEPLPVKATSLNAVAALTQALKDDDAKVREAASQALAKIQRQRAS